LDTEAGAACALQELSKLSGPELEAAERRVKQRTLGNIRLIAELFNKEVVREPIVHACIGELLGDSARVEPVEDNIEVRACAFGMTRSQLTRKTSPPGCSTTLVCTIPLLRRRTQHQDEGLCTGPRMRTRGKRDVRAGLLNKVASCILPQLPYSCCCDCNQNYRHGESVRMFRSCLGDGARACC
jgi:hypothetical protein